MLDALFRCDVVLALQIEYLAVYKGGLNVETMSIGEFPVYAALTMLVIDCVLYLLLAVLFAGMLLTVLLIYRLSKQTDFYNFLTEVSFSLCRAFAVS